MKEIFNYCSILSQLYKETEWTLLRACLLHYYAFTMSTTSESLLLSKLIHKYINIKVFPYMIKYVSVNSFDFIVSVYNGAYGSHIGL